MDSGSHPIAVPVEMHRVVGEPVPGTRLYRKEGPDSEASYWSDALFEKFGPMVSPGGVTMYAPVSRAAVHMRIRLGKMTAFAFYTTTNKRSWFGKSEVKRELDYIYVPVEECRAWKAELEKRAIEKGVLTQEELEGETPDWHDWFMDWNSDFVKTRKKGK